MGGWEVFVGGVEIAADVSQHLIVRVYGWRGEWSGVGADHSQKCIVLFISALRAYSAPAQIFEWIVLIVQRAVQPGLAWLNHNHQRLLFTGPVFGRRVGDGRSDRGRSRFLLLRDGLGGAPMHTSLC